MTRINTEIKFAIKALAYFNLFFFPSKQHGDKILMHTSILI